MIVLDLVRGCWRLCPTLPHTDLSTQALPMEGKNNQMEAHNDVQENDYMSLEIAEFGSYDIID
jgi:hypothetical protein